ncbi:MAG: TonB-dependent receptor [Acidobacteriaceae bacterium]|nr:TonB-dependent receptor [Acidobacteriaceae bacterium]
MSQANTRFNARIFAAFTFLMCFTLTAPTLFAQGGGFGAITGVVQDSSGAVIPGAKVVIDNASKGIHREMESNGAGAFNAPALVPASGYTVKISKSNFGNYEAKNITVTVGENVSLSPVLGVVSAASNVEVTGEASTVDQTKTANSALVNSRQILDLPINGRRVDEFVLLTPGVAPDGIFGLLSFRGNPGGNSFLTDGNDTTNQFYDENAGRSRAYNISQDAVQEFQVVSSNFLAEYGKASGGVVNTVTRSGTNSYHGTAYEFFRNRTLNATDVNASGINPPEWRHQAGMSIGGPIKKDKLFFFFNGELTRRNAPIVSSNIGNNTVFDSQGNFLPISPTGTNNCGAVAPPNNPTGPKVTPTAAQCAAAGAYMSSRARPQLVPRTVDTNLLFGKLDYRPNDKNSFSLSTNYLDFRSPNGIQTGLVFSNGSAVGNNADTNVFDRTGRASWTYIVTPSAVNEVRYGLFIDRQFDNISPTLLPSIGPVSLSVSASTGAAVGNLGFAAGYPRLNPSETRHQLADTYTWTKGAHNMKFGVDWNHIEDYVNRNGNLWGTYSYSSISAFALDFSSPTNGKNWNQFTQTFGNPIVDTNLTEISLFAQDQWRVTSKLSVDYGLRYDHTWIPQPVVTNPAFPQTAVIPSTSKNFAPRFGFAYSLDDKTVFRGGYGLFFNRYTSSTIENLFITNGVYQQNFTLRGTTTTNLVAGPSFPSSLAAAPTGLTGTSSVLLADPNFRNPYSQQASLAVERELAKNTNLSVSYVWSRGLHLLQTYDANVVDPGPCPQSSTAGRAGNCYTYTTLDVAGNKTGTYTSPVYTSRIPGNTTGSNNTLQSAGNSYYNGLLVNLTSRYSSWLEGGVAYTYSHAIDNNQGGGGNTLFGSTFPTTAIYNGNYQLDRGSSSSDQRHRLTINATLNPTFMHSNSAFAKYVVNNWQLAVVELAASSLPLTPSVGTSGTLFSAATGFPTTPLSTSTLNGLGGSFRVPFESTSALDIGPTYRTDARLSKMFPITERVKVSLGFEASNIFNHLIPTGRQTAEYTAKAGTGAFNGLIVVQQNAVAATPNTINSGYGSITSTSAPSVEGGTSARRAQGVLRILF